MAKDKLAVLTNKASENRLVYLQENEITIDTLKDAFYRFPCKAYVEDDELFLEVDEIDVPILVSINHDAKYISFSCIFDVSETLPFETKVLIVNEVNNSIPFIKFIVPSKDESNDCIYSVSDLGFVNGVSVIELERVAGSFFAALTLAFNDSELYKLNG